MTKLISGDSILGAERTSPNLSETDQIENDEYSISDQPMAEAALRHLALLSVELPTGKEDLLSEYDGVLTLLRGCPSDILADAARAILPRIINELSNLPETSFGSVGATIQMLTEILQTVQRADSGTLPSSQNEIVNSLSTRTTVLTRVGAGALTMALSSGLVVASAAANPLDTSTHNTVIIFDGTTPSAPSVTEEIRPEVSQQPIALQTERVLVFDGTATPLDSAQPASPWVASEEVIVFDPADTPSSQPQAEALPGTTSPWVSVIEEPSEVGRTTTKPAVASDIGALLETFETLKTSNNESNELDDDKPGQVKVMSYNVLGFDEARRNGNGGGIPISERVKDAVSAIKQASPGVIAFQEMSDRQFGPFKKALAATYKGFPAKQGQGSRRVIYWEKDRYERIDSGIYEMKRSGNSHFKTPWVKLRDRATKKMFYVFNFHATAGGQDDARKFGGTSSTPPPKQRKNQVNKLKKVEQKINKKDLPALLVGDFNSPCENDSAVSNEPCKILQKAGFQDAGLAAKALQKVTNYEYSTIHSAPGKARKKSGRHIDHVFVNDGFTVNKWENLITQQTIDASDHTVVMTNVSLVDNPRM